MIWIKNLAYKMQPIPEPVSAEEELQKLVKKYNQALINFKISRQEILDFDPTRHIEVVADPISPEPTESP